MSKQTLPEPTAKSFRRKPLITALEQRVLLDGAAVATAVEVMSDTDYDANTNTDSTVHSESAESSVHFDSVAPTSGDNSRRELAVVDKSVKDYETLVENFGENTEVIFLETDANGLEQVLAQLEGQGKYDAIHVFSHGDVGQITLGNVTLNDSTLDQNSILLESLSHSLNEDADILLYGCFVGADNEGSDFLNTLSGLTGADIAASDDLTGSETLGGDWQLEKSVGSIETSIISADAYSFVLAPTISQLADSFTFSEGGSPVIIDSDVTFTGGNSYTEGYIRFSVDGATSNDFFTLTSDADPSAVGAISVVNGDVYLGNGSGRDRIGSIDDTENGQNGNALKINFSSPLPNAGFEEGEQNWTVVDAEYGDNGDEINLDGYSVNLANDTVYSGGTGTVNIQDPNGTTFNGSVADGQGIDGSKALYLNSSGSIQRGDQDPAGSFQADGYGSIHGPYARSSVIAVQDGDSISLEFKAVGSGDDYEVFGLLRKVDSNGNFISNTIDSNNIVLFAERGEDTGGYKTVTYDGLSNGDYRFEFVGGTYDGSGGLVVGSNLYVDNIRLISNKTVNDSVASTIARQVTYHSTATDSSLSRNVTLQAVDQTGASGSDTITLNITQSNNSPSFIGNANLQAINEDVTNGSGASVSSLFSTLFNDPDASYSPFDTLAGIVVTQDASLSSEGQWQYSTDAGSTWQAIGSVSDNAGLLLSADSLLRFVPSENYNGSPGPLTAHAVDSSDNSLTFTSATSKSTFDTTSWTSDSAVSQSGVLLTSTINAVNDAPTVDNIEHLIITDSVGADILGPVHGVITASDIDNDKNTLSYAIKDGLNQVSSLAGLYGTLTITGNTYTYTPNNAAINALNENQQDTFTLVVSDPSNGVVEASLNIDINIAEEGTASYTEQADPTLVLDDAVITTDLSYSGGYIEFDVSDASQSESLSLLRVATADTADGAVSIVDNAVYLGDGSTARVIGSVDSTLNGENGNPLRINFSVEFANGDFESATPGVISTSVGTTISIDGWNVVNDRVTLGSEQHYDYVQNKWIDNTIGGLATPEDTTYPWQNLNKTRPDSSSIDSSPYQDGMQDYGNLTSQGYYTYVADGSVSNGGEGNSLQMRSSHWSEAGYEVIRGPYVYSQGAVALEAGDEVSFHWKAEGGSDAYDVFGYIVDVNTNETQVILNETGASASSRTAWARETVSVSEAGEYMFVFVSGTFDATGGEALGAQLYIDDVEVTQANPSGNVNASVLQALSRMVTYENSSDLSANNATVDRTINITTVAGDEAQTTHTASQALRVTEVNDATQLSQPVTIRYTDTDAQDVFSNQSDFLSASDPDSGTQFQYGLQGGVSNDGGLTYEVEGQFGTLVVNSQTGEYTYQPDSDKMNALSEAETETFSVTASDGATTDIKTLTVEISSVNDAPLIGGVTGGVNYIENNDAVAVTPAITIDDPEGSSYEQGSLTIRLTDGFETPDRLVITEKNGITLSGSDIFYAGLLIGRIDSNANGSAGTLRIDLTANAYSHQVQSLLRAVEYSSEADDFANTTKQISVEVNDGGNGGATTPRYSVANSVINITEVNDSPVINNGDDSFITEKVLVTNPDGEFVLSGIEFIDPDSGALSVVFELNQDSGGYFGALTFDTSVPGGLGAADISGNGTGRVSISGTIEQLNATLAAGGLKYTAEAGYDFVAPGPDMLTITAQDSQGASSTSSKQITVIPAVPNADSDNVWGPEDTAVLIDLESLITDINDNGGSYTLGTGQSSDNTGSGGSLSAFSGNEIYADYDIDNDGDVDADDTSKVIGYRLDNGELRLDDATAYMGSDHGGFVFIPDQNWNGKQSFIYQYTSGDSKQSLIAEISIYSTAVNDKPLITTSSSSATLDEDTSLTLGGSSAPQILLTDVDNSGDEQFQVSLSVEHGVLSLASLTGVAFIEGSDNSGKMLIEGRLNDLQAAIESMTYTPDLNFNGHDRIEMNISDLANTGSGGELTDSKTIALVINPVNDAPVAVDNFGGIAVEAGGIANADTGSDANSLRSLLDNDTDVDAGDKLSLVSVTGAGSAISVNGTQLVQGQFGTLTIDANGNYSYAIDNNNPNVQALRLSGQTLTDTFSYQISDTAGLTSKADLSFIIDGRNDVPEALTTNIDTAVAFGKAFSYGIAHVFNDVDAASNGEKLSLTAENLPEGISLDPETGILSGVPTGIGKFSVVLTATDSLGESVTRTFELEIVAPPQNPIPAPPVSSPELPPVSTDTTTVSLDTGDLPDGTVDDMGTGDPGDQSGYVESDDNIELAATETAETTDPDLSIESTKQETLVAEDRVTAIRYIHADGSVTLKSAVEVNVNESGVVVFSDVQREALSVISMTIADIQAAETGTISIEIHDTLAKDSVQHYAATLGNGDPLPAWIQVDPDTGNLTINNAAEIDEALIVRIKAIGQDGTTRILEITLNQALLNQLGIETDEIALTSSANFMEQLRTELAGYDSSYGESLIKLLENA